MNASPSSGDAPDSSTRACLSIRQRLNRWLFGARRELTDSRILHRLSVVAFLAWVGLGADGISSSCYGPEEAFRTLGNHTYLAIALAVAMTLTVTVISIAYSRVIEHFPQGGGGYVVATTLLGKHAGLVSGSALLVDYVLTITVSIAAAGDALFSFLPSASLTMKLPCEFVIILTLTTLNMRGVKESIMTLLPIFLLFLITHAILILGGVITHLPDVQGIAGKVGSDFDAGFSLLGAGGILLLFIHAYSLGGGTYTGIEAVSNGLSIMREPKVRTGKRTMLLMAASLAFTASGLILCYLLWQVSPVQGKTMNAVLAERFVGVVPLGNLFVILTLISEGALLVVAAQAGFVDGPRVLANMAVDGWAPRRFAALSEQLTTRNGIMLMGAAAVAALLYTRGNVQQLVVMYSINVFVTFSLTELGMCRFWIKSRLERINWKRKIGIHIIGLVMCATILVILVLEKFDQGGWLTMLITALLALLFLLIRRHYEAIRHRLSTLFRDIEQLPISPHPASSTIDPNRATAVILVGGYTGLGMHTTLSVIRKFPERCHNIIFVSVAVADSDIYRRDHAIEEIRNRASSQLSRYIEFARSLGIPAESRDGLGTDAVAELERICLKLGEEFRSITYFAGQLVFSKDRWFQKILHNETAFALQKRLQLAEHTMVILPARVPN